MQDDSIDIKIDKIVLYTLSKTIYSGYNYSKLECIIKKNLKESHNSTVTSVPTDTDEYKIFLEYLKHTNIK